MDCHFKKGDVILLSDKETVKKVSSPDCLIEEGVIFRFFYDEAKNIEEIKKVEAGHIKSSKEKLKMDDVSQEPQEQPTAIQQVEQAQPNSIEQPEQLSATTTQSEMPFDVNQALSTTNNNNAIGIILAIVAILGGGAAWKFYQKFSEQKHEQAMKKLEIEAQSQGLNGAQPPPCQTANAAIQARLTEIETKIAMIDKKTSSFSANTNVDEMEQRITKIERKVKTFSSRSTKSSAKES